MKHIPQNLQTFCVVHRTVLIAQWQLTQYKAGGFNAVTDGCIQTVILISYRVTRHNTQQGSCELQAIGYKKQHC